MNLPEIPTSYDTLKFTKYVEIIKNLQSEKPDDYDTEDWNEYITYVTLSILLDIPVEEVKKLPNGSSLAPNSPHKYTDKMPRSQVFLFYAAASLPAAARLPACGPLTGNKATSSQQANQQYFKSTNSASKNSLL